MYTASHGCASLLVKLEEKGGDEDLSRRVHGVIMSVWEAHSSSGSVKRLENGGIDCSSFIIRKVQVIAQTKEQICTRPGGNGGGLSQPSLPSSPGTERCVDSAPSQMSLGGRQAPGALL